MTTAVSISAEDAKLRAGAGARKSAAATGARGRNDATAACRAIAAPRTAARMVEGAVTETNASLRRSCAAQQVRDVNAT